MSGILLRIKRAVVAGNLDFSEKARMEMLIDQLLDTDVAESILNSTKIEKTIRSTSPRRRRRREYLHIIRSVNYSGVQIYTKGKLVKYGGVETYYLLISAKRPY
jgi:hypothetical protein